MEKLEYKTRIEEMKNLLSKNKFADAMTVADTINWRKVHNINDLLSGSEAYETAGKNEEARDLLLLAHERSPIGRMILYKLCMISIKLKDLENAQEYYTEFVQIAPHDSLKYILKYHISIAKGADNATLIKILEQLKEQDFIEDWAYELAYLYHKTNQAEKCIDLCDEIILWFGDGPIVERALELKMLYQPLDKNQENTYRHLQQKKDGITEITANEPLLSGEIVPHTITIPSVELPAERFNTVNLQAEIKKSIDEIMKATEAGEVNENIDAIKNLVEEIPYLQIQEEEPEEEQEPFSVNDTFQQYLKEGFDGQISLLLPDEETSKEEQIEGQITIDDVMAEWEKTKKAAEAAMQEAKNKELESARAKALREANTVLNRLEGAMTKMDAGMTSSDLLKEEYLSQDNREETAKEVKINHVEQPTEEAETNQAELPAEEAEINLTEQPKEEMPADDRSAEVQIEYLPSLEDYTSGFAIPKLNQDGVAEGSVDIPIVKAVEPQIPLAALSDPIVPSTLDDTTSWEPPTLNTEEENEEVDLKEASQAIADVNKMLQLEIDRLTAQEENVPSTEPIAFSDDSHEEEAEETITEVQPVENEVDEQISEETILEEIPNIAEDKEELTEAHLEETELDFELPTIELPADLFAEDDQQPEEEVLSDNQQSEDIMVQAVVLEPEPEVKPIDTSIPILSEEVLAPEEVAELVDEKVLSNVIADEVPKLKLDDEDLKTFSYFLPISGMKANITQVLTGAAAHLQDPKSNGGNIVIVGEPGSGKTQMARSIIQVLQKTTSKPAGGVGKISGEKLNEKDIQSLYEKIQGGCLIIETAGDISQETAVTLSLLMQHDNKGTIVIIEDSKKGISKALSKDPSFAKRFTEKIVIPVFSIDELVSFAKTYALEAGCSIDDMGVLALYNRINLVGRYDHATTIKEVAEIMDEAIEKATKKSLFNKPKYDKSGNIILKEKNFDN